MSMKLLYGLPATLLTSSLITETSQIDLDRIIQQNVLKNKEVLLQEEFKQNLESFNSQKHDSNLLLPVNVMIYDNYYNRYSEWKYWDKYTFEDNVLVFDKKQYDSSESYQSAYKKVWLNEIRHMKDYKYYKTNMGQFPYRDDNLNINWIDGKGSGHQLKNILSLSLPEKIEKPFEMHKKIVQLNHAFPVNKAIEVFSGYWKNGQLNKENNVISEVEYGNLKLHPKRWSDIYHNFQGEKVTCQNLETKQDKDLKEHRSFISEGFDSKCHQINVMDFWSFFWYNRDKNIYSSGYVGYKYKVPNSWTTQYFYYSLGEWMLNRPVQYQVNEAQDNNDKIWYIDFDNVFIPEVKVIDSKASAPKKKPLTPKSSNQVLQLSIYLNYDKIKELDAFWKISPHLNYQMKFKLDGKEHKIDFQLKDVLEGKNYKLENSDNKFSNYSFSNFELLVNSNNSKIKMVSPNKESFKYKLNLSIIKQRFNLFHSILLDQDELKNYYYSELKNQEKLEKLFYSVSTNPENNKNKFVPLTKEWLDLLNIKITGSDFSPAVSIEYYDFLSDKNKKIEYSDLQFLPNFSDKGYIRKDKFSSTEEIITAQTSQRIGKYFWDHVDLKLSEKDILEGTEKYQLTSKNIKPEEQSIFNDWFTHYKNSPVTLKNSFDKYLVPKSQVLNLEEIIKTNNFKDLFRINHERRSQKINLALSDFEFKKVGEAGDYIEVSIEYKGNSLKNLSPGQLVDNSQKVNITGKTKFKLNKRNSYMIFPENSDSLFYFSTSENAGSSESSSFWKSGSVLASVIAGVVTGGGLVGGIGMLLSKKLKLFA
ncbi:hypothetical protein MSUIS_02630 [Mycoplasma suis KI3806]|uniref:Uncharacterized protein n=1 Tax=Mycoplasma suis (strain KI_3806) TaxID=708248 RepID=F0V3D4_MYCS3|nr:hypothetical protein [Mycoplasma suis]CBZ40356.1 hypothetical protein MSUIS_02630 [Mycoplasma suis KI3806]